MSDVYARRIGTVWLGFRRQGQICQDEIHPPATPAEEAAPGKRAAVSSGASAVVPDWALVRSRKGETLRWSSAQDPPFQLPDWRLYAEDNACRCCKAGFPCREGPSSQVPARRNAVRRFADSERPDTSYIENL